MSAPRHPPTPTGTPSQPAPLPGPLEWRQLVDWLAQDGVIDAAERARTVARCSQAESRQHPLVRLGQVGMARARDGQPLDTEALTQWLAGRAGLPYLRIDPLKVEVGRVAEVMSASYAERHQVLPVRVTPHDVVVATSQPFDTLWVHEIERQAKRTVKLVVANPEHIRRSIGEFFSLAKSVREAQRQGGSGSIASFEQLVELGGNKTLDANDQGVVQLVDWLWQYAFDQRASDIHLEPRREQAAIRFRIDGVLHRVYQVPAGVMGAMVARIKLLGRMDVVERRRPQDGRIKTRNAQGDEVEMRLSTLPTAFGEKLVMRIFDPGNAGKDLSSLGFPAQESAQWRALIKRPHGIVLVTGPTGSGKTTTLYATLKQLATEEVNISTIEDPIEMVEPLLNQTQVQPQLDLTFASGLRSLLRQDPDVLMVGEIRDQETADMAVQAALTGHLVFSTLHTNDAPTAITRLLELGVASYLINATLLAVLAQRLVRLLCEACRQPDDADTPLLIQAAAPYLLSGPVRAWRAVGCEHCRGTGYRGRMGLYELLNVSDAVREALVPGADAQRLRTQALQGGMRPLRLAGIQLAAQGRTTLDEVLTHTPPLTERQA